MADDACSAVKSDLQAGTPTNYTTAFPIYIENKDVIQIGNVYILLKNATREPVQTVDGSVLYTKRGCTIEIIANSDTIRDAVYLDVIAILTKTNRGYKIKRGRDSPIHQRQNRIPMEVSMLL